MQQSNSPYRPLRFLGQCSLLAGLWLSGATINLAQASESTPMSPSVRVSVSLTNVTGGGRVVAKPGEKLGLRVEFTEYSDVNVAQTPLDNRAYVLPRLSLFKSDGKTLKRIEVVAWLDPRHFSLYSDRHGLLVFDPAQSIAGQRMVFALPRPGDANEDNPLNKMRLILRGAAPLGEISTVGILLLADQTLIADFSLPLMVAEKPAGLTDTIVDSPFRPKTPPGHLSVDGVLTLVELHEGNVQLTFSCASGMKSWRVTSFRPLKDWPKYVDQEIEAGDELQASAATFSGVLFPTDSLCSGDCSGASSLFKSWARHAADDELPPSLTVQSLPLEKDEAFAPVLMPIGMLSIKTIGENHDLPEEQSELTGEEASKVDEPHLDPTLQPNESEGMLATTNVLALLQDPADPLFEINWRDANVGEPAELYEAREHSSAAPLTTAVVDPEDPADQNIEINQPLIVRIDPVAQDSPQVEVVDPADLKSEINKPATILMDPVGLPSTYDNDFLLPGSVRADKRDYLAYNVFVHIPIRRFPLAAKEGGCASGWSVMLPPPVADPLGGLDGAKEQMQVLIDNVWDPGIWPEIWTWRSRPLFQISRSLAPLRTPELPSRRTGGWLIVSHYDNNAGMLRMPNANGDGKMEEIVADQLLRKLASPGVVVLLACQIAVPGPHSFLSHLIENGTLTLISNSAKIPGVIAGQFATAFIGVLGEAGPAGIAVEEAFWEALRRLPKNSQYAVPRFFLAGDPTVRLCAPPLVR
jgi:hypothetical protein